MKPKTIIGLIAILAILVGALMIASSDRVGGWFRTHTPTPTSTHKPTITPTPSLTVKAKTKKATNLTPVSTKTPKPTLRHSLTPTITGTVISPTKKFVPTKTKTPTNTP